jgi:hypothetical protein
MPERPRHGSDAWRLADLGLLAEAGLCLVLASVVLRAAPFHAIARWVSRGVRAARPLAEPDQRAALRISRAVGAVARRAPWVGACFSQALACCVMLRRRRLPARLFYGARSHGALGPRAHVWVRAGELGLVGSETATAFALLATFPPLDAPQRDR